MAITYPLTLPNTKSFRRVRLYAINTVGVAKSPFTHTQQVQEFSGQSWGADVQYPDMTRDEAEQFNAFLLSLMGQKGTFWLGDPLGKQPRGSAGGNPRVNGANQVGNAVITDGWTPSISGILLAGDYIQISNSLYKVLTDANSDAGGNATLDIWPRLSSSPANDELVVTTSTQGIFRLTDNVVTIYEADEAKLYSIGFNCIEVKQ